MTVTLNASVEMLNALDEAKAQLAEKRKAASNAYMLAAGPAHDRVKETLVPYEAALLAAFQAREEVKEAAQAVYLVETREAVRIRDAANAKAKEEYRSAEAAIRKAAGL